jgi:His-Xaa-Ser system radical SAM maturase HxsB
MPDDRTLWVNDAGRFFAASEAFRARFAAQALTDDDLTVLKRDGHWLDANDELGYASHARSVARRLSLAGGLDYLILVPTLRCNLSCTYCQVSRVGEQQIGFDWSEETLAAVLSRLDEIEAPHIKIEFQGGEPTLRPDLIETVIERAQRIEKRQFVICTNLLEIDDRILAILDRGDVFVSTSLDGDWQTHMRHRTHDESRTSRFFANLRMLVDRYGPTKISALPTVDAVDPPDIESLIDAYGRYGLESIFLRPINYQGFARKRHSASREQGGEWWAYYDRFIEAIIERNWEDRSCVLEETYLSICLRRIFRPGTDRHVDLRNPNAMGIDYVVIDYDGTVYPTDEARMLTRSGVMDLSIGDVASGWDSGKRQQLNSHCSNQFDPDCTRCAFQPYCGRDVIDDIARYGTIDIPRHQTEFCRKHMHIFDLLFRLIYSDDEKVCYSLARWLRLPASPEAFGQVIL